jgi:hypothetical protein
VIALLGATAPAAAQSRPIAVASQPAGSIDVLVPVDAALRATPAGGFAAQLTRGGAKVTSVTPLTGARAEIALAFDISSSFKSNLPASVALAKRFVEQTKQGGFAAHFSVYTIGIQSVRLGDETALDHVLIQPAQQRTQLRKLTGELITDTAAALRFPDGVREVVLFTDGGEESAAFQDYAQITDPATAGAVIVDAVIFLANTPSTQAATLADKLGAAVQTTGGAVVRVDPARSAEPDTQRRLDAAAAIPASLVRVHLETCGLATPGPGEHDDTLSFTVTSAGQPPLRSAPLPVKLQVPAGGAAPCAPATPPVQVKPPLPETEPTTSYWPWVVAAAVLAAVIGLVIALTRRTKPAPPVPAPVSAPIVPLVDRNSTPPPLVVPSPTPWLEKHGANPLARTLATELHVEASAIPLGSPLRIARPEIRVGRGQAMDLALDHASLSEHHATLLVEPSGELYVIDHGSESGTFVERQRVAVNQKHHVPRGAELSFSTHIRLRVVQPWRAKATGRTP